MGKVGQLVSGTGEAATAMTDAVAMLGTIKDVAGIECVKTFFASLAVGGVTLAALPASALVLGAAGLSGAVAIYKALAARKESLRQEQCREWLSQGREQLGELLREGTDLRRAADAMENAENGGSFEDLEPGAYGTAAPQIVQFQTLLRLRKEKREDFERMAVRFDILQGDVEVLTKFAEKTYRLVTETHEDVKAQGAKLEEISAQVGQLPQVMAAEILKFFASKVSALNGAVGRELTQKEKVDRAFAELAEANGVPVEQLKAVVLNYAKSVRTNPQSDSIEKARAEYVAANYLTAAKEAGAVAMRARARRFARDAGIRKYAAEAAAKSAVDRAKERDALILSGQSFHAARQFGRASNAYNEALEITPRGEDATAWAALQLALGDASDKWADVSEGAEIAIHRKQAVEAYRSALKVYTREALPHDWATTQNNLGLALANQAAACEGAERVRLIREAMNAYRNALEVCTREALPQDWADTQNNLGNALCNQAAASEGEDRVRLLGEAVTAYRQALEVRTREALPQDWAATQNNLGIALRDQGKASEGENRARLLGEAVRACRQALGVHTREALPQKWATTQINLGNALSDQAKASVGTESARLLGEAENAYRFALEVYTREVMPQEWAMTQNNLGAVLQHLAAASEGAERIRLHGESVAAYRSALEVQTREALPRYWAQTSLNLAQSLILLAAAHLDAGHFDEAEAIFRENVSLAVPGQWTFVGMCILIFHALHARGNTNPLLARAEALLLELGGK